MSPWGFTNITTIMATPVFAVEQIQPICRTSRFPILMYHHIREYSDSDTAGKNISVSPREFREQMQYLAEKGYETITTKDIINNTVPCKSVMITFDDGYYDVYKNAFPIMQNLGYRGLIALVLGRTDESDYLFGSDIRKLQNAHWEIANHTWDHLLLSQLQEQDLKRQINDSKKDLEKWFHLPIDTFVYPGGFYNPKALQMVEQSGYKYAFSTHFGEADLMGYKLTLNRINIMPGTNPEKLSTLLEEAKKSPTK